MPYQVLGLRSGAVFRMSACSFLAMPRSGSCISAIFARTAPSAFSPRASARRSAAYSFIAARSSSLNFTVVFLVVGTPSPPRHADQLAPHMPTLGRVLEDVSHAAGVVLARLIVGRERRRLECLERGEASVRNRDRDA